MALYKDMKWQDDPHLLATAVDSVVERSMVTGGWSEIQQYEPSKGELILDFVERVTIRRFTVMLDDIGAIR